MALREIVGTVISNKMNKTITVIVKNQIAHKQYSKIITKTNKYYAHDENNKCMIGDRVIIQETKPLSKNKRWTLLNKIINQ